MARHRFRKVHSAWIANQLLQYRHVVHTKDTWRTLYNAFIAAFLSEDGAPPPTMKQYTSYAKRIEKRQENDPVARAMVHTAQDTILNFHTTGQSPKMKQSDHDTIDVKRPRPHHTVGKASETTTPTIKQEPLIADTTRNVSQPTTTMPKSTRPALLRTRPSATAARSAATTSTAASAATVSKRSQRGTEDTQALVKRRRPSRMAAVSSPSAADGDDLVDEMVARLHRERITAVSARAVADSPMWIDHSPSDADGGSQLVASADSHAKSLQRVLREAQEWREKYEDEKALTDTLQSRLDEALATVKAHEKELKRLQSSTVAGDNSQLTFTINVNVDVARNGERVGTTAHAIRMDNPPPTGGNK